MFHSVLRLKVHYAYKYKVLSAGYNKTKHNVIMRIMRERLHVNNERVWTTLRNVSVHTFQQMYQAA